MKLYTLSTVVLVLWICTWSADGQRCLLSRLERLPCPLRPALPTAGINQYGIYQSRIRTGPSGLLECRLRGRRHVVIRNIPTLGTKEVRLLFSPGSQQNPPQDYDDQMLVIYNVRCNDDERVFFNITWQDIQPRNCGDPPVCADYIQVIRSGGFGVIENCGNETGNNGRQLQEQEVTVIFRTSEVNEYPGFEMYVICYKPEERDLPGCTRVEGDNVTTSENDTASGEGPSSRNRRDLQEFGLAEQRVVRELMQSQFAQLTPADDVVIDVPKLPTQDPGYLGYRDNFTREKRQADDDRKFDATAVRTSIVNENACNPILRAATRSVLTVNTRINKLRVHEIREELQMAPTQPPTMQKTIPTMETDQITLGTDPTTQNSTVWQTDRCLLSRLPCPLQPGLPTAGIKNISTFGTNEVRLLYSPGAVLEPPQNYTNQMLVIYNVRCDVGEAVFYNITWQDIQPRNCGDPPICADYIQVTRSGGFGITESCGKDTGKNSQQFAGQAITVQFRTSEADRFPGFRMNVICYRPAEHDLPGCTRMEGDTITDTTFGEDRRPSSRKRRDVQEFGLAEKRVLMELTQAQFSQLSPADDVMIDNTIKFMNPHNVGQRKRQTDNDRKFDATAVRTAIMNENACNPVLRAMARAVLTFNLRINASRVREIREELRMVTTQPPTMPKTTPTLETDPTTQNRLWISSGKTFSDKL